MILLLRNIACEIDGSSDRKRWRAFAISAIHRQTKTLKSPGTCVGGPSAHFDFARFLSSISLMPKKWTPKMVYVVFLCSTLVTSNISCTLPTASDFLVSSLRCSPSAFDSFRANTEIRYTLASAATITLYIAQRSEAGELVLVKTLASNIHETKGSHGHTWLGDTHQGVFAESGEYIAILQIESNNYEAGVRVFHW